MENQYLLDTNICVFFMRGKYDVPRCIQNVGRKNCYISEITVAELLYGAANCSRPEDRARHTRLTLEFVSMLNVLPISYTASIPPTSNLLSGNSKAIRKYISKS